MSSAKAPRSGEVRLFDELGIPADTTDLIAAVKAGLPYSTFSRLRKVLAIDEATLADLKGMSR